MPLSEGIFKGGIGRWDTIVFEVAMAGWALVYLKLLWLGGY